MKHCDGRLFSNLQYSNLHWFGSQARNKPCDRAHFVDRIDTEECTVFLAVYLLRLCVLRLCACKHVSKLMEERATASVRCKCQVLNSAEWLLSTVKTGNADMNCQGRLVIDRA